MTDLGKAIAVALISSLAGGAAGGGGSYAVMNWRLGAVEDRLAEADSRQQIGNIAAINTRLTAVEARVSDNAFSDWTSWRATVKAKQDWTERELRRLERKIDGHH